MKYLLDTNILIWWLETNTRLSPRIKHIINEKGNSIYVSSISAWEMNIKKAIGKLTTPDDLEEVIALNHFIPLSVTIAHAMQVKHLPLHHRDPFDRMIIAQAQLEQFAIITADPIFEKYSVAVILNKL